MTAIAPARRRVGELDRVRGLAIVLMILDHLAIVVPGSLAYRLTLGRCAMPLFFVLAGYLSRRLTWRHLHVGVLGLVLPLAAPFLDHPNVLTWWALGGVLLAACRRLSVPPVVLVAVGLTLGANGYGWHGSTFEPFALFGLMAAGAALRAGKESGQDLDRISVLEVAGRRLPCWLEPAGRHPILVYTVQALLVEALILIVGAA